MNPDHTSKMTRRELVTHAAALMGSGLLLPGATAADDPHAGHLGGHREEGVRDLRGGVSGAVLRLKTSG